jgi:hypothetical protein
MADKKQKIKSIFKTAEDARKDAVDLAKKNLEEDKPKPKKLDETSKKRKRKYKNTWMRRLFYGPGTLWGAGGSCSHNGSTDGGGGDAGGDGGGDGGGSGA